MVTHSSPHFEDDYTVLGGKCPDVFIPSSRAQKSRVKPEAADRKYLLTVVIDGLLCESTNALRIVSAERKMYFR